MIPRLCDAAAAVLVAVTTFTVTATAVAATTTAAWTIIAQHASPMVANDYLSGFVGVLVIIALIAGMFGYAHEKAQKDDTGHASGTDS